MTEQRQHPRYAIELDAEIGIGQTVVTGRTRDISRGGFCMVASRPIPINAECIVKLALVFSENQFSEHLELPATIVWCTPLKNGYQVGVKFAPLPAHFRGYLDLFIKFLDRGDEEDEDDDGGDENAERGD